MKTLIDQELSQINFLDERFYGPVTDKMGEDHYYPSVTHILNLYPKGAAFTQWLKDVGNSAKIIAERAAESGSKVHDGIERLLKGEVVPWGEGAQNYTEEEWRGLNRFLDFYKSVGLTPEAVEAIEINVFSHEYKYAGTCDMVCMIDGKRWLIDHKFGNAIYPSYFQQVTAYKVAFEEMNPHMPIDHVGVLHLKANIRKHTLDSKKAVYQGPGWKLVNPENETSIKETAKRIGAEPLEIVWENFLRIHGIYYYENPKPMPKSEIYPLELSLADDLVTGEEGSVDKAAISLS